MAIVAVGKTGFPSSYTVELSSNLNESGLSPVQATFASIEVHGAVQLYRFTDGERVEKFELSEAEFEVLISTYKRRRRLLLRARQAAFVELGRALEMASSELPF